MPGRFRISKHIGNIEGTFKAHENGAASGKKCQFIDAFIYNVLPWNVATPYRVALDKAKSKLGVNDDLLLPLRCIAWLIILANQISVVWLSHYETARGLISPSFMAMERELAKLDDSSTKAQ